MDLSQFSVSGENNSERAGAILQGAEQGLSLARAARASRIGEDREADARRIHCRTVTAPAGVSVGHWVARVGSSFKR